MEILISALVSIFLTLTTIKFLSSFALKINLVDKPDKFRKSHLGEIPLVGGISILSSVIIVILIFNFSAPYSFEIILGTAFVMFFGFLDDLNPHHWLLRLCSQVLASIFIISSANLSIESIGSIKLLGEIDISSISVPLTILCVVGLTNAINLLDGIDGLASIVIILALSALLLLSESNTMNTILILFISSTAAFLHFNLGKRRNKIFLGDAGSLGLGFLLSWELIYYSSVNQIPSQLVLWLVAIPLLDTFRVMLNRYKEGKKLFEPDRKHLHHILIDLKLSKSKVLTIIGVLITITSFIGVLINESLPEYSYYFFFLLVIGYTILIKNLKTKRT